MTENNEIIEAAKPNAEEIAQAENCEDTIPSQQEEITIPIKFNKEMKNLTVAEAGALAQKGMKYDLICDDYEILKGLSRECGKSVTEFLEQLKTDQHNKRVEELTEKCGGDQAFAQHIIELENNTVVNEVNGFSELKKHFPEIKSPEELPQEILESAKLKGSLLLDEYLRYLLAEKKSSEDAAKAGKAAENASVGSQLNRKGAESDEALEFLRGLWK